MKSLSIAIPDDLFFRSTLDERRDWFLKKNPRYKELEKTLFKFGGKRLIYMPLSLKPGPLLKSGKVFAGDDFAESPLPFPGACHSLSLTAWKMDPKGVSVYTGYAMTDAREGLWRHHSWIVNKEGVPLETTGPAWECYFGMKLNDKVATEFHDFHFH